MTNPISLIYALVGQIPGMGVMVIHKDDNQKEFLWFMFHVRHSERLNVGYYIYRYKEKDSTFDLKCDVKLTNDEGDTIYLYQIS